MTPRGAALAGADGLPPVGLSSFGSLWSNLSAVRPAEPLPVDVFGVCTSGCTRGCDGGCSQGCPTAQEGSNAPPLVQPWPTLHHVSQGRSLGVGNRAGVFQDEHGEQRDAPRKKWVEWSELLADVPEQWREATDAVGRLHYPEGRVPAEVAWSWGFLRDVYRQLRGDSPDELLPDLSGAGNCPLGRDLEWVTQLLSDDRGLLAWCRFWPSLLLLAVELDARRLGAQQRGACGRSTWECVVRVGGELHHLFWRYTCKSERCRHCSKRKGLERREPLQESLERHAEEGRFGWFLTLTLSPNVLMAKYGVSWRAARMLSWRQCRPNLAVLIKRMRRNGLDVRYVARTEAHASGFAHLHPIVVSAELTRLAVEEAECADFEELVALCAEDRAAYEAKEAAWKAGGKKGRRPGRRCRFPKLRQKLKGWGIDAGFGASMFWLEPVRSKEDVASYVAKDTFSIPDVVGEVTKSRQLAGRLIPRGTKTWNSSRGAHAFFVEDEDLEEGSEFEEDEAAEEDTEPEDREVLTLVRHYAPIEQVRELLEEDGLQPGHDVHGRDMRGEPPGKGGQWPFELQSLMLDIPVDAGVLPLLTVLPRLARGPP